MTSEYSLEWKYIPVTGSLIDQNSNKVIWDLKSEDSKWPKYLFTVSISQQKEFMSDPELGWNWHKSWNLPDINYTINFKNNDTTMRDFRGGILEVQLFVIKKGLIANQYISLGLNGNSKQALFEPSITFSGLKFGTTSYNNKHSKFNLIFVLFYSRKEEVLILDSQISSDVFVDSRNRSNHKNGEISQEMFIDLFPPLLIDQILYKRENEKQLSKFNQIDNSLQGFINYYTSPNIRNKIKHPLFMIMRFSKCIKLFLIADFIKKSQSVLMQVLSHLNQVKQQLNQSKEMKLLINIENSNQNTLKKVLDIIKQLENNYYEICIQRSNIPSNSVEITDICSLTSEYKRKYKRFINHAENQKYNENSNTSKTQKKKLKYTQKNHQIQQNQGQINLISQNKQQNQDDEQINKEYQVKEERDLEMNQQKVQEKNIISKDKNLFIHPYMNPHQFNNQFQISQIYKQQYQNLLFQYCHQNQLYGDFNLNYPYYYHQYHPKE